MSYRAVAVTVAAAAAVAVAASGCRVEAHIGPRQVTDDAGVSGPVTAVQLATGDGDITIRTGPGSGAAIHRTISYRGSAMPHPSQQVVNGVLTFVKGCSHCSVDYDLTVPSSVAVQIRSGGGDIRVAGVRTVGVNSGSGNIGIHDVTGRVWAHTGSGDVAVHSVGEQTDIRASSGNIVATGVGGGTLLARSGSGDMRLVFSAAPSNVRAVTGSGNMVIEVPGTRYRIDPATGTGSGDMNLGFRSDPTATATIYAKTGSGDLRIESAESALPTPPPVRTAPAAPDPTG